MNLIDRVKNIFTKAEYYSFENFNIRDYHPRFELVSVENLLDITELFEKQFSSTNLSEIISEIKILINQDIVDNESYRDENDFRITYFFHSDLFKKKEGLFLSQCISSDNKEIGQVITSLYSFESIKGIIKIKDLN